MFEFECNECIKSFSNNDKPKCPFCGSDNVSVKNTKEAHTIKGFIESLQIFAKYAEKGLDQYGVIEGQYESIGSYITNEQIPEFSNDGKRLQQLGWFIDDGYWDIFT